MNLIPLLILCYSSTTVSQPLSFYTLSNPAFTAQAGNYQVYIEPKGIGDIAVFNCSARWEQWGFGFSNARMGDEAWHEHKNWLGVSYTPKRFPVSLGINCGIREIYDTRDGFFDFGAWLQRPVQIGFAIRNFAVPDVIIRGGITYTWRMFFITLEGERLTRNDSTTGHGIIGLSYPLGDFTALAFGGYHPEQVIGGVGLSYQNFFESKIMFEEDINVFIGISFRPPVVVREVTVVETLLVEGSKPIIIEKRIVKSDSPPPKAAGLTAQQKKYCEVHYLKGIEYYLNNEIKAAIREWTLVTNTSSQYRDVQRYLENARAKLKLLEED